MTKNKPVEKMVFQKKILIATAVTLALAMIAANSFLQNQTNQSALPLVLANDNQSQPKTPALPAKQADDAPKNQPTTADSLTAEEQEAVLAKIMPKGVPEIYGSELEISFDEPEKAIVVLSKLDGDWIKTKQAIRLSDLNETQKQRYQKIGMQISCEFCCSARTLIAKNGLPACKCVHSAALRGAIKYLLKNHENEFSDEQVLEEATKIKTISFPKQMVQRALELQALRKPIDAITQNLPSQVGGC